MKKFNVFVVALAFVLNASAADVLTEKLQRGLFEEEANHNLDAAIKEYQSVVAQSDEQRKVTATALFRLGECYRKLGKTNEANTQYQRILRDFSEQEQLVKVAGDLLKPVVGGGENQLPVVQELERRIASLRVEGIGQRMEADRLAKLPRSALLQSAAATNDARLIPLLQQLSISEQRLATLGTQFGAGHPDMRAAQALRDTIQKQLDDALEGIVAGARIRADSLENQLKALDAELKKASASTPAGAASSDSVSSEEAKELTRIQAMVKDSPDLVNDRTGPLASGRTPLHRAAESGYLSVAEFLLAHKADVNAEVQQAKYTPLHLAASRGHKRMVELLIANGADVNRRDQTRWTPLHFAARGGFRGVVEVLLAAKADVNAMGAYGEQPLHGAAQNGYASVVELLLAHGADLDRVNGAEGTTSLRTAAANGHADVVALLVKKGADIHAKDSGSETALRLAARNNRLDAAKLLLDAGADPNSRNSANETPLYGISSMPMLELLLSNKANPNEGKSPLAALVSEQNRKYDAIEALVNAGANPSPAGYNLLFKAVEGHDTRLVDLLLKHGADPNVLVGSYTPLSYAEANLSAIPTTPEAGRAKSQWEQIVKALRDGGANPFLRRFSGITYTRPNWTREDVTIFSRGTNDYNRYTLFEFLAALFAANNAPAFPDFAHVTVERIEATNAKPREMAINVDELLRANDCSKDIWLEWGDRVSFPELDHPLNEQWPGLARETTDLIVRCLTRRVRIIVKQETNTVKLIQSMSSGARVTVGGGFPAVRIGTVGEVVAISDDTATPREKPEKTLYTFRLKEVVYGANVLRASSDPKRVRVSRLDRATNKNNEWLIDLTKVATAGEGNSSSTAAGKLGTGHDLWLRDGDVIEIPEKQ